MASIPLLAEKLRELRIANNFTQKYISKYLQMTRGGYSQYELGNRTPSYEMLLKLSELYHINVSELINSDLIPITKNTDSLPSSGSSKRKIHIDYKSLRRFAAMLANHNPSLDVNNITKSDIDFLMDYKQLDRETQKDIQLFLSCKIRTRKK